MEIDQIREVFEDAMVVGVSLVVVVQNFLVWLYDIELSLFSPAPLLNSLPLFFRHVCHQSVGLMAGAETLAAHGLIVGADIAYRAGSPKQIHLVWNGIEFLL